MNRPAPRYRTAEDPLPAPSCIPLEGWHCLHAFYGWNRAILQQLAPRQLQAGVEQLIQLLDTSGPHRPERLQVSVVSGLKADFGLMLMDPDPWKLDHLTQLLAASPLGAAVQPRYSFVSISEVSEYVPTAAEFADNLVREGLERDSDMFQARVKSYAEREVSMRYQRLTPDFPAWPATCFYPMNKKRTGSDNWFVLPVSERKRLMAEHARSGMSFMGKVTQLITVSVGFDDWEWGVTLWARNPQHLKEIVYQMRFDAASARYAEFGPFYVSYPCTAEQMLTHCLIAPRP